MIRSKESKYCRFRIVNKPFLFVDPAFLTGKTAGVFEETDRMRDRMDLAGFFDLYAADSSAGGTAGPTLAPDAANVQIVNFRSRCKLYTLFSIEARVLYVNICALTLLF